MDKKYDRVIIGAGIYGLYAAKRSAEKGFRTLVLECEKEAFTRATYINQARVHLGYHYPRSISTALKSGKYFDRFNSEFAFCINDSFEQIYATARNHSWTNGTQFYEFCQAAQIPCELLNPDRYFKPGKCDAAYLTTEYTYDAKQLRDYLLDILQNSQYKKQADIKFGVNIASMEEGGKIIESLFLMGSKL